MKVLPRHQGRGFSVRSVHLLGDLAIVADGQYPLEIYELICK